MAGTTASQGIPYAERPDPFELTADLKGSFNKIDSVFAQTRGESTMALSQSEAALVEALRAVQRVEGIEDPIHVGPAEPTDGERLWVDTDEDAPPSGGGEVTSEDITDATNLGRRLLTSQWSVDARNALSIFTGTRALLDAGTDTAERTWDAKELHEYVTDTAAAAGGAASWDDLTGKPETFPPSAHTHDDRYYTEAEVDAKIASRALASHPALYVSGIRNMDDLLVTGWTPATYGVLLSRQGGTITLALDVSRVTELSSFADIIPIPNGFRPILSGYIQPAKSSKGAAGWYDRMGINAPLRLRLDAGQSIAADERLTNVISWQTTDPIPVTLPGKPA